jgi:hypothetical protein
MATKNQKPGRIDRRRLLQGAGLAVGAAAATSPIAAKEATLMDAKNKPKQSGYRESEDVRIYYKSARY